MRLQRQRCIRERYAVGWLGVLGVASWLITSINTPSTVEVPGGFFIGGLSITLMVAVFTILFSFPLGIGLALARTSSMPIFRHLSTGFIEIVRGVPLIPFTILCSFMVPLCLPPGLSLDDVTSVLNGDVRVSAVVCA